MGMEIADIQTAETPAPFKPAVGRIVHFYRKDNTQVCTQGEPAMITRVHSDHCVNLTVFMDSSTALYCFTSVTDNPHDSVYWIPVTRL